ncbi:DUF6597 domain-containing transcriptional factor [Desertivirga arenae]|uniref:DUF6597 domain-containing transcriptional factor n=1 Tax=Desertivirga arenae TaxID=2810309 RepID=UPI001A972E35|nr:DUF6597 domain-containing transcriptional factor [Pedobacter sp. SYSU D00823]
MKFQQIQPYPSLQSFIERIFVLECEGKLPINDLKLIVPNACVKLVFPFKNSITADFNGSTFFSKEGKVTLIGFSDLPSVVDIGEDEPSGNITVEFSPLGAYRFFNLRFSEIKNTIYLLEDVLGKECRQLEDRLEQTKTVEERLKLIQDFLLRTFIFNEPDTVYEYCVQRLIQDKGRTLISDLEHSTGYSSRWLNAKFNDNIGTSAKNLSSIIRFQQYYQAVNSNREAFFFEREFYHYYYDQSHFIKDIKRFTGFAPKQLLQKSNDYDRFFYKG